MCCRVLAQCISVAAAQNWSKNTVFHSVKTRNCWKIWRIPCWGNWPHHKATCLTTKSLWPRSKRRKPKPARQAKDCFCWCMAVRILVPHSFTLFTKLPWSFCLQVAEKLKLGEKTAVEIDKMRDGYRPAAKRGAILFFVLSEMSGINRWSFKPNYLVESCWHHVLCPCSCARPSPLGLHCLPACTWETYRHVPALHCLLRTALPLHY